MRQFLRNLFKCSSCERLENQIALMRQDFDLWKSDLKEERDRCLNEVREIRRLLVKTPSPLPDPFEDSQKPIRGVGNPRKVLGMLTRKDAQSFVEKQKDFEKQVKDAN